MEVYRFAISSRYNHRATPARLFQPSLRYNMPDLRRRIVEQALFRGAELTFANRDYLRTVRAILGTLLETDTLPRDATVAALGIKTNRQQRRCLRGNREWRRGWKNMRGCSASTD
jgi:hypothetical protein